MTAIFFDNGNHIIGNIPIDGGLIYQKHRPLRRIECTHSTQTEELSVCSLHTCFNTAALFHVLMLLILKPPSFNG
jgi:hypothetical protein